MGATIAVEGLVKRFGSFTAVDGVGFEAPEGKITALLGPSGSGKSTVLRMIAGLERPTSGRITLAGEDQTDSAVQERRVGFVFQHYALFRHMTVRQNVAFGLSVRKESKANIRKRVDELLDLVHLGPFAERYPHNLSGGQRQRVALARALAPHPKVLLLDEPFGALDARVRRDLRHWLDGLHRELGVTSLLVTHDQEEALELANRVVVMHLGKVEQIGSPEEIYNEPATPFVAGFVGAANVIQGNVRDGHLRFAGQALAGADHIGEGEPAQAYIRPHDVRVSSTRNNGDSVAASLDRSNNLGWMSKLHLRLDDGQTLIAHVPNEDLGQHQPGDRVWVDLRNAKIFAPADGEAPSEPADGGIRAVV
ncbi:MAG: sulfate/molybdate ABC transporter ATP-binding protein [Actinomycetota bacterium]|nr:sulfate/molybdate ABC transporter ATP-binding protein [Actinomycetota bacterium]